MATCVRCHKEVGFLGSVNFNKHTQRCSSCEKQTKEALERFRLTFLNYCKSGALTSQAWANLQAGALNDQLNMNEALFFIRSDALGLLQQQVTIAVADGIITEEEERVIKNLQRILAVPEVMARPVFYRLEHLKYISSIRQGKLPSAQTSLHLESGELCHLVIFAAYHKVNSKSTSLIPGQMIATSKKLLFLTQTGGTEIAWNNIMSVKASSQGVYLQLSRKSGNGFYEVSDPLLVEAIIDTSVRIAKRQILGGKTGMDSRHIPQDVRNAVWQGDQGRCVECGAQDYLEYDHIIPHSKGGANTVGNVQLLCRRCNNRKSDRI